MKRSIIETILGAVVLTVAGVFFFFAYTSTDIRVTRGYTLTANFNAIDGFLRDDLAPAEDEVWREAFAEVPTRLTVADKREWLGTLTGVAMGSDAFIPFRDNIDRAAMSGVTYIVQPGGSVRDQDVVDAADQYGMLMALSGVRLFHH